MSKIPNILIIEDDKYFRLGIKSLVKDICLINEAETLKQAIEILSTGTIDFCIVDLNLGKNEYGGLKVLELCQKMNIDTIVLSSTDELDITEKVYSLGCQHFLVKSQYKKHLRFYIEKLTKSLDKEIDKFFNEDFITSDENLKRQVKELLDYDLRGRRILITGETGVGKSLLGKLIHKVHFKDSEFVHLNCSEISENLIESELFGHLKGSFTGAIKDKVGLLAKANNGVLFLDEIATMPMTMQKKLLNAIESGEYYPVGSDKPQRSNFTLISATCEDLIEKIHSDDFRKDLFFRISGFNLNIPALRERKEDLRCLIKYFLNQSPRRIILKDQALNKLLNYDWPGNTRELKRVMDNLIFSNLGIINEADIKIFDDKSSVNESLLTKDHEEYIVNFGLREYMKKIEKEITRNILERNNGKVAKTIKDLKISASAFYRIQENL
tara:strand:- start:94873 stop:96192 length:1320 start_codon:yes stop_codon:yes gene_type:complete